MKNCSRMARGMVCAASALVLFSAGSVFSLENSKKRLDLFDAQGNHLMYVMFDRDRDGKNTGRTVYMSDSTFVRSVAITRNAQGERVRETSFDYHDDTMYTTAYSRSGQSTSLTVRNQFKMDQFGGPVSYRPSGTNDFVFSQRGADINKLNYEFDGQGNPAKITVFDNAGTVLYYGTFSEVGTLAPWGAARTTGPLITMRGNNQLTARFVLTRPSRVRCELIALNGRHVGDLFNETLPRGAHEKRVRVSSLPSLKSADGMYVVVLTIDGVAMARSRQLIVRSGRSGS